MGQRLLKNIVQQLRLAVQPDGAVLDAGDGQQILHQIDEPLGVIVHRRRQTAPLVGGEGLAPLHQDGRVAGNAGERRAQVVGDAAQQVRPQRLLPGGLLHLLLFAHHRVFFQGETALVQDGEHEGFFKAVRRAVLVHRKAHGGQRPAGAAHRQIQAPGLWLVGGGAPRVVVVGQHPAGQRLLALGGEGGQVGPGLHRIGPGRAVRQIKHHVTFQKLAQLVGGGVQNMAGVLRLLELLAGLQENLGAVGLAGALLRLLLDARRAGGAKQRHNEHHREGGHRVRVGAQRIVGRGEKIVVNQHRHGGGQQAVAAPGGGHRDGQHAQNVHHDRVGRRDAAGHEQPPHQRTQR